MAKPPPDVAELPLTPLSHAILLALADADLHGYGIIKEVERQTDGALRPGTGTLYAALQRLRGDGLLAESAREPGPDEDARRKYYRLTAEGRRVARAESLRLARMVTVAREKKLLDPREAAGGGPG